MRAHVFQHVPFEGLGSIEPWLAERGAGITWTRLHAGELPPMFTAFHWHGETFAIPEEAKLLASSAACRNQAFCYGNNVIGLQFHLETNAESARLLVENCGVTEGSWVKSAEAILNAPENNYRTANEVMARVLAWLTPAPRASP